MYKAVRQRVGRGVCANAGGKSIDVVVLAVDKQSGRVSFRIFGSKHREKIEIKTKGRKRKSVVLASGLSLKVIPESDGGSTIVVSCKNKKYHLEPRKYEPPYFA